MADGCIVINKSQNPFSMNGIDHNHEQENLTVKDGGRRVSTYEQEEYHHYWLQEKLGLSLLWPYNQ